MDPRKMAAKGALKLVTAMFNGFGHSDGYAPLEAPDIDDAGALKAYALEMQRRLDGEAVDRSPTHIDVVDATDVGFLYEQGDN